MWVQQIQLKASNPSIAMQFEMLAFYRRKAKAFKQQQALCFPIALIIMKWKVQQNAMAMHQPNFFKLLAYFVGPLSLEDSSYTWSMLPLTPLSIVMNSTCLPVWKSVMHYNWSCSSCTQIQQIGLEWLWQEHFRRNSSKYAHSNKRCGEHLYACRCNYTANAITAHSLTSILSFVQTLAHFMAQPMTKRIGRILEP